MAINTNPNPVGQVPNQQQPQKQDLDLNNLFFSMTNDGEPGFTQLAPIDNQTQQQQPVSNFLDNLTKPQTQQPDNNSLVAQQAQQIQALQSQVNQLLGAYNGVQQTLTATNPQNQGQRKSLVERLGEPDGEQYFANLLAQSIEMGVQSRLQPLQPMFQQQMMQSQIQQAIEATRQQFNDFNDVVTPNQVQANQLLSQGFTPREIYLTLKMQSMSGGNFNNNNVVPITQNNQSQRPLTQQDYAALQQQQKNMYMTQGNFGQLTGNSQFSNPVNGGNPNRNPTLEESFQMAVNQNLRGSR